MKRKTQSQIRANLQSDIWEYVKRRESLKTTPFLSEMVIRGHKKKNKQKIDNWRQQIKRMDERKNRIIALGNAVAYFTGINVKGIGSTDVPSTYDRTYNATALFSKYGLEHQIMGNFLSEYMGRHKDAAGRTRLNFTRSFKAHPDRQELYHRFCEYMERLQQESIENSGVIL